MCIDPYERAESLGIDHEVYFSACKKLDDAYDGYYYSDTLEDGSIPLRDYPMIMTDDEIVAVTRWQLLDKRFPEYFSHDGFRYDLHPELARVS